MRCCYRYSVSAEGKEQSEIGLAMAEEEMYIG